MSIFIFGFILARFFQTQLLWTSLMHKLFYIQSFAKPLLTNNNEYSSLNPNNNIMKPGYKDNSTQGYTNKNNKNG